MFVTTAFTAPREMMDLDGVWNFATDPDDCGETEKWFMPAVALPAMPLPGYAPEANGMIRVPGIWDNQGYGVETDKVRHNFVGKGWYKRQVDIPRLWAGRRVFFIITGVSRSAKAWVNGRCLGEHIGFVSAFEWEVTKYIEPGQPATLVIEVDSEQRWEVDALYGACSLTDYMDVAWGGIWGHVSLEARSDVWLSDLYMQPNVIDSTCTVTAALNGRIAACDAVRLDVFDVKGEHVAESLTTAKVDPASSEPIATITAKISNLALWTPDRPTLYTAKLTLLRGIEALDAVESRFGMRQFSVDGSSILLNGKRILLRGYGDDHIYPEQMAMPSDKELHLKQLRIIKSYGFNHVRHHSTMMPPEYYDACDEIGILCNAEFPIVYSRYLPGAGSHWLKRVKPGTDPAPANKTLVLEWSAAIKRFRNHPSILTWVMGNELYGGVPLRLDFQREKIRLDPTRFFCDSDGVWGFDVSPDLARLVPPGDAVNILDPKNDRNTLDLYFLQVVDPLTYAVIYPTMPPKKPVVVHEMGNFLTFTRPDIIGRFRHNIKPFWLTAGDGKLKKLGRRKEAAHWAEKSERLYTFLHKSSVETIRKNPFLSGYHWWLFQDYWTTSNGLVDLYFRPKSIPPDEVLKFNNDVVLLEDGLQRTYRGRGKLEVTPMVSNYSNSAIDAEMCWEIRLGRELLSRKTIPVRISQGQVFSAPLLVSELPDVTQPTPLKVAAELSSEGRHYLNDWTAWLYPADLRLPKLSVPVFVLDACRDLFSDSATTPFPAEGHLSERAVYVTETLSEPRLLDAMTRGASILLLGPQPQLCPSFSVTFGTTWWKAGDSPKRNHTGTFVYDHPVTRRIAPEAYCDEGWFDLLEGGIKYVVDDLPSCPSIIIRALSSMVLMQESALLFEVGVGKGCLIASGLNHRRASGSPENQWLLARLLAHAATFPNPKATWPESFLLYGQAETE